MLSSVLQRITVPEIAVAVLMYIIVRSIIWCLRQAERVGETEVRRIIHAHVHQRHGGHYKDCKQCTSTDIAISEIDLAL
jgi:hypothetical protein